MLNYSMPTYDICIPKGVFTPLFRDTVVLKKDMLAIVKLKSFYVVETHHAVNSYT